MGGKPKMFRLDEATELARIGNQLNGVLCFAVVVFDF